MEKKEIKKLADDLLNNKITLEDIILNYSIEVAGKVDNFLHKKIIFINLNISINGRDQDFYEKTLDYIEIIANSDYAYHNIRKNILLFNIINNLSDKYKEKITSDIFDLVKIYFKKIIASKEMIKKA